MVTNRTSLLAERSTTLRSLCSFVQRPGRNISWKFVSSTDNEDGSLQIEFESKIKNSGRKYHLNAVVTPNGEYYHYSVS